MASLWSPCYASTSFARAAASAGSEVCCHTLPPSARDGGQAEGFTSTGSCGSSSRSCFAFYFVEVALAAAFVEYFGRWF